MKNTSVREGSSSYNFGLVLKDCPQKQCCSAGDSSAPQTTPGSVGRHFSSSRLEVGAPRIESLEAGVLHNVSQCTGRPHNLGPPAPSLNSRLTNPALTFSLNSRKLMLLSNNLLLSGIRHPVSHLTGENCCYNEHPFCAVSTVCHFFHSVLGLDDNKDRLRPGGWACGLGQCRFLRTQKTA